MELTWWRVQAAFLPLPLALVAVLSTPAPRKARQRVLWFVEQVLGWEVRRPFQLMHFALLVTGFSVLSSLPLMLQAQQALTAAHLKPAVDANYMVLLLGQKFRHERNFWLSVYAFSAWVVLHIVHKVNKEKHELRGQLLASQGRGAEAAQEVAFVGRQAEAEMCRIGREAQAAGKGPLAQGLQAGLAAQPAGATEGGRDDESVAAGKKAD